ncbi:MAG: hypothetical protein IPN06_08680 [Burkholderiales bacterium]|nr:hypothetical protein [Burkholderiales bacterium]
MVTTVGPKSHSQEWGEHPVEKAFCTAAFFRKKPHIGANGASILFAKCQLGNRMPGFFLSGSVVAVGDWPVVLSPLHLCCQPATGRGRRPVASVTPNPVLWHLEDPALAWTLDDVRTGSAAAQFGGNLPDGSAFVWATKPICFLAGIAASNTGNQALNRLLEIGNPSLAVVEFHQPDSSGAYVSRRTGGQLPFDTRAYAHRHFEFPITCPPQRPVVYVRLRSQRPMSILAKPGGRLRHSNGTSESTISGRPGILVLPAPCLFNLLFIALRDLIYVRLRAVCDGHVTDHRHPKRADQGICFAGRAVVVHRGCDGGFCFTVFLRWGSCAYATTQHVAPRLESIARLLTWSIPLCAQWASCRHSRGHSAPDPFYCSGCDVRFWQPASWCAWRGNVAYFSWLRLVCCSSGRGAGSGALTWCTAPRSGRRMHCASVPG